MDYLIKTTLTGLFFGTFGTTLGGIIGAVYNNTSKKFLSFILQFAAGLMTAIICFDLIPEAIELSGIFDSVMGVLIGVIIMIMCDSVVKIKGNGKRRNTLVQTGIIIGIGLSIHNFPEGLAIGSGFSSSIKLGYSLAIAILLHDIPEGISMAIPMKNGGMKKSKVIIYTILSGMTTGLGAFFGALIGGISSKTIAFCLAISAGAMLYIVSGELVPESNNIYKGKAGIAGNIAGFILGVIAFSLS